MKSGNLLRILMNNGDTVFEGDDYSNRQWKTWKTLLWEGKRYPILANVVENGTRIVLVSSKPDKV